MTAVASATAADLHRAIAQDGFVFVRGAAMGDLLAGSGSLADWPVLREAWNHLQLDSYMADGGRYRRRRHAVFAAAPGG